MELFLRTRSLINHARALHARNNYIGLKKSRWFSSINNSSTEKNSYVVLSDNGQVIVCWHPEPPPPYEHTKPLPVLDPEFHEEDSVLKLQYRRDAKNRFKPDGPDIKELAKMTYTTKHRWYPNNEKRYEDPDPPRDREGI